VRWLPPHWRLRPDGLTASEILGQASKSIKLETSNECEHPGFNASIRVQATHYSRHLRITGITLMRGVRSSALCG
jgi:hypothetical protein